jgi:hypothetical protein
MAWRRTAIALPALLAFLAGAPVAALAQAAESRAVAHRFAGHVSEAAARFGLPEAWIWRVMRIESAGDARAVSRAGARGLMQVMPATWAELRVRYGLGPDPFDPRDNIMAGAAYLREMYDRFGWPGFLAAYNAGPARYENHLATGRPLPAETRAYLATLTARLREDGDAAAAPALPDPHAWRRASLFPARSTERLSAVMTDEGPERRLPSAEDAANRPSETGQAEGRLFFSLSGQSSQP